MNRKGGSLVRGPALIKPGFFVFKNNSKLIQSVLAINLTGCTLNIDKQDKP